MQQVKKVGRDEQETLQLENELESGNREPRKGKDNEASDDRDFDI